MRTYLKLTTCATTAVCLIFTQLNPGMLSQDNANNPRIASTDNETVDVPTSASNVSQASPVAQTPAPQTTPTDSNKKQGKSKKKWILIGVGVAAAITAILLINKSEPETQVTIGTPSVGGPQ